MHNQQACQASSLPANPRGNLLRNQTCVHLVHHQASPRGAQRNNQLVSRPECQLVSPVGVQLDNQHHNLLVDQHRSRRDSRQDDPPLNHHDDLPDSHQVIQHHLLSNQPRNRRVSRRDNQPANPAEGLHHNHPDGRVDNRLANRQGFQPLNHLDVPPDNPLVSPLEVPFQNRPANHPNSLPRNRVDSRLYNQPLHLQDNQVGSRLDDRPLNRRRYRHLLPPNPREDPVDSQRKVQGLDLQGNLREFRVGNLRRNLFGVLPVSRQGNLLVGRRHNRQEFRQGSHRGK